MKKFKDRLVKRARRWLCPDEFGNIHSHLSTFNTIADFMRYMKWTEQPIILQEHMAERGLITDINDRRRIDAEIISIVCKNANPRNCLEIGTSLGVSTARMAVNAPQATIFTVNIPPEEYEEGGVFRTHRLEHNEIGRFYRQKKLDNIEQIFANTATWEPHLPPVDIAFIDGSHDTAFVYSDTRKVLKIMQKGGFLLWHDFNPELINRFEWIRSVMMGVELLYRDGILKGDIYHIRDSWFCIKHIP
ncbi:MAG: class I SAM-dependent methyltransferase [Thermodesulfobacteriota bacterium]|nr:class I SAM-dependent methyltransferase [Thermodesulfobacteriota bacterium]